MDPQTAKPATDDPATPADGSATPGVVLEELVFLTDYRGVFSAGERLSFRAGVNLLVGDQGAGKSSLLTLVAARWRYPVATVVQFNSSR